jgi:hypothetical protein
MKTKTMLILGGVAAAGYFLLKGQAAAVVTNDSAKLAAARMGILPKMAILPAGSTTGAGVLQTPSQSGVATVATEVGPGSLSGTCFSAKRGLGSLG